LVPLFPVLTSVSLVILDYPFNKSTMSTNKWADTVVTKQRYKRQACCNYWCKRWACMKRGKTRVVCQNLLSSAH